MLGCNEDGQHMEAVNDQYLAIGMADIGSFVQPCNAVPACLEQSPHIFYLFLKPRMVWSLVLDNFMKCILNTSEDNVIETDVGPIY